MKKGGEKKIMIHTQKNINGLDVKESDGEMSTLDWVLRKLSEKRWFFS